MDGVTAGPGMTLSGLGLSGQGQTPLLRLDGFDGPLDLLLRQAQAQQLDLARISLLDLIGQLTEALEQVGHAASLGQKGDWVIMVASLLQLRSRLLLPAATLAPADEPDATRQLRLRLGELQRMQALAAWLDRRPQRGRDVFERGRPEPLGATVQVRHEVDVVAFLWASLALFEDPEALPDTMQTYRPLQLDLHDVPEARLRIVRRLAGTRAPLLLDRLLPEVPRTAEAVRETPLRLVSAWTSSFTACLELAKQGDVVLDQDGGFTSIEVSAGLDPHPEEDGSSHAETLKAEMPA